MAFARETIDERIYEAYEGCPERDAMTDKAMQDLFGAGLYDFERRDWAGCVSWQNDNIAYKWSVLEADV